MTTLVVAIVVYVVGLYVATLLDGLLSWSEVFDGPNFFTTALWPLALVFLATVFAVDTVEREIYSLRAKPPKWFTLACRAWFILALPFRPWRIGRMLRERRQKK